MTTLSTVAIVSTAFARPQYLERVLSSWQKARGIRDIHSFTLALGHHPPAFMDQIRLYDAFRRELGLADRGLLKPDSSAARASRGMHRAIGEAANWVLSRDPAIDFLVFGEEDIVVSSDVLEYMSWARGKFADNEQVLCVCAHSAGGQGWDPKRPIEDGSADQATVRLSPSFNAWCWGTWRDRWERILEPDWDWECSKGPRPDQMGYDWGIYHAVQREGYLCMVPDASRSQNIGREGGWAANPADFPLTQAPSFREERPVGAYRLAGVTEQAA